MTVFHLNKVIKPAGMNFPELMNLRPITTVRVPEVPVFHQRRETRVSVCELTLTQINRLHELTQRQPHILRILRCQISTDRGQQTEQEPGGQGGDAA